MDTKHDDITVWVRTKDGVAFAEIPEKQGGRMPDFCIIGSPKCGTTSLDKYLANHPKIFMNALKEPHYFSTREILNWGETWYKGLYADARDDQLCGEASTSYTRFPLVAGTAERMAAANPMMKLIYLVRPPVERVQSELLQTIKYLKNVAGEDFRGTSLDDFLISVENPSSQYYSAVIETSRYEAQIQEFERFFPPEQILILTQGELRRDAVAVMDKIYAFLGLDPDPNFDDSAKANTTAAFREHAARDRSAARLRGVPGYTILKALLPARLKVRLLTALAPKVDPAAERLSDTMRTKIAAELAESTVALEKRLGIAVDQW